jgi:DNA segregation ATPase FtsK/SpoIIIE, S-DNA-T family
LSWLKKIFKMFHQKDEIQDYERTNLNYEYENKNENKGKELEARVTYQYPKGHLRFPQISDEEKIKTETTRLRTNRKERTQESQNRFDVMQLEQRKEKKEQKPRRQVKERLQQRQIDSTNVQNVPEIERKLETPKPKLKMESRTKITKKSSRPFRPTEIPSPIYGFKKTTPEPDVVEFELISDVPLLTIEKQPSTSDYIEGVKDRYLEESVNTYFANEIVEESNNSLIEKETLSSLSTENLIIEKENHYFNKAEEMIEVEETPISEVMEDSFEIETLVSETLEVIKETAISVMLDEEKVETPISLNNDEIEEESFHMNMDVSQTDIELNPSSEPMEKKQDERSHLPFNVLMLKQDKRKWEQKRIEQAIQRENLSKISEEIEVSNTETEFIMPIQSNNEYTFPTMDLLNPPMTRYAQENRDWVDHQEQLLNDALKNFGVRASVVNITQGPSVTRFEVQPEPGVKVNKITNLSDDIKLSLAAKDIRIEAPIPGKHTIGIEVPNKKSRPVLISEIIKSEAFQNSESPLTAVLGLDISGAPVVTDLKKMPHGLIAGATGSGKSVCINSILISLLYKACPHELKLLLIDPKMVELAPYNHIPHLVSPVITDVKAATAALKWAVDEMERRYELFAHAGVRDINRFNEIAEAHKRYSEKLPFIVIIIDELADLMMMSPADVEESICRIAQKARACGIHLIIATQRPSVDVITGLIKANVPTRTAFSVSSQIDSRTIIDISGAEKLLGRGDMLFLENGSSKPVRLQGTFVSDAEIDLVVEHVRKQQEPEYLFHQEELLKKAQVIEDEDELFYEACEFVIEQGGASTSSVQRRFKIGYNRAARLIDMMEQQGFISEPKGSKPRDVLITEEELEQIQETTNSTFI